MGNVNYGITGKGKTDPLMKKIYIAAIFGFLLLLCTGWTCTRCTSGPSEVATVFHCTFVNPDGTLCKGTQTVMHPKKIAPGVPT